MNAGLILINIYIVNLLYFDCDRISNCIKVNKYYKIDDLKVISSQTKLKGVL
tara:strand:- start:179 stop:334 length:156 start_codon:yes stop_codon:yes gene_type:complete